MNVKETIKSLKNKFPGTIEIKIEYRGSGDSFEDFWNLESIPESNIQQEDVEDLLWYAIDNSEANWLTHICSFSEIKDLINEKLSIDNYWIVYEREPSGLKEIE